MGESLDADWVTTSSLAAPQVAKVYENSEVYEYVYVYEPLKNRNYLGKKLFFNFLGADFVQMRSPMWKTACIRAGLLNFSSSMRLINSS